MNQFLAGLIERATLSAPVLERRPRSLFEPLEPSMEPIALDGAELAEPADLDLDLDERMGPSQRHEAASLPRPERATGDGPKPPSLRSVSAPAEEVPPPPGGPASPAEEVPPPTGSPASLVFSPARHVSGEPRLVLPAAARHVELERFTEPHEPHETTPAPARPLPSPARDRAPLPMPARLSAQRSPIRHDAGATHEPPRARNAQPPRARNVQPPRADSLLTGPAPTAVDPPLVQASVPLLPSGPRLPVPPALLARSQAAPRALQSNGLAAPPPAPVHVTIGRVEVRATSPAADRPPARRPPAGPRMTLEKYLNGQRGGSR